MNFQDKLSELNACRGAREWVGSRTLEQAWAECPRADWMLWLATKAGVRRRTIVGASAAVARDVLPAFEAHRPGDTRVRDCLDACDRYAVGEDIDLGPYKRGALGAYTDAYDGYAAYAAYAAYDDGAAYAAYAAYDEREAQARHADIVRKMIPVETIKKTMEDQYGR